LCHIEKWSLEDEGWGSIGCAIENLTGLVTATVSDWLISYVSLLIGTAAVVE